MTPTNAFAPQPFQPAPFIKRSVIGASIALAVIAFFVFSVNTPRPEWGTFWMVKPLIITPLAGAAGGGATYLVSLLGTQNGWQKALAILVSVVGYIIALWLGIVLGLNGTLWN